VPNGRQRQWLRQAGSWSSTQDKGYFAEGTYLSGGASRIGRSQGGKLFCKGFTRTGRHHTQETANLYLQPHHVHIQQLPVGLVVVPIAMTVLAMDVIYRLFQLFDLLVRAGIQGLLHHRLFAHPCSSGTIIFDSLSVVCWWRKCNHHIGLLGEICVSSHE
jgi:hypothetical protein